MIGCTGATERIGNVEAYRRAIEQLISVNDLEYLIAVYSFCEAYKTKQQANE